MKLKTNLIEPYQFLPIYRRLTDESKRVFQLKIKRLDRNMNRYAISEENFNYLNELLNSENPNTIGKPADFDFWQVKKYFDGLTQLINTPEDFQILSQREKDSIIEEHKIIHKKLITYKLYNNGN